MTEDRNMEKKKLLFVFNPKSGKGQIKNRLLDILDTFVKSGYEVVAHPTQAKDDARLMIERHARNYDLVVCSGGDGTLDEAVSGMMESPVKVPIGYIPAGSTNDFAASLRIPKNMLRSADIAVNGKLFPCDVGGFNEDYFSYVAAFGLFTDVSYQTSQNLKNVLGHGAYIIEGAKRLVDIPSYILEVEVNGEVIRDEFIYGMITNSTSVGGIKNMTGKDVMLDDGLFEVNLIKFPQNPLQLNEILTNLMMPKAIDTQYIYSFKTDHMILRCENQAIPWTLDGEFGGNHRDVEITNHKRAVQFMVKAKR